MQAITPKKDKGATRPGRKTNTPPVTLTPEEVQHQAALADIKRATGIPAAFEQWTGLRDQVNALCSKKDELDAEYRKSDGLRSKAAHAQDYVLAQAYKEKQDALQKESNDIAAMLKPLAELRDAAEAHHTELFLADEKAPYNRQELVTLCRTQVINPVTGNFESVSYLDSSDNVSLQLDGESFSSEAYHLQTWAAEHGFVVRRTELEVCF